MKRGDIVLVKFPTRAERTATNLRAWAPPILDVQLVLRCQEFSMPKKIRELKSMMAMTPNRIRKKMSASSSGKWRVPNDFSISYAH